MTSPKVLCSKDPFYYALVGEVEAEILNGNLPARKEDLRTANLDPDWDLMRKCWGPASDRPFVNDLVDVMKELQ